MRKVTLVLLAILLSACAASGPVFSPLPELSDKATVYVYRPKTVINCCVAPDLYINGEEKGALKNGGYLAFHLSPGKYKFTAENESVGFYQLDLGIALEAGKSYYVKWFVGSLASYDAAIYGGIGVGVAKYNYHLVQLPSEIAEQEIRELKYSGS